MQVKKAIIIGAGIGGIATAIRLAVKGFRVEVFEAGDKAGGKLNEITQDSYRFDAGPSLLTMPQYIDDLFKLAGKNPREYINYHHLEINCRYFFADGKRLTAYADEDKFKTAVGRIDPAAAHALKDFRQNSRKIYDITKQVFLQSSLHRLKTYCKWSTARSFLRLAGIDAFRTMHNANKSFFKDRNMIQFYDRYATYNGSDPYQAPATLNVIPHLEQQYGAYFPEKGMYSIVTSLVNLAESAGVTFNYNADVRQINLKNKKAVSVTLANRVTEADIVISNIDVWSTYKRLLAGHPGLHPAKILNQQRSSSALIFYWGMTRTFPELDLHNIFFSSDYAAEFDAIWQQDAIGKDPTVYVNISSKFKTDDAPEGCENWFVMINTPPNKGQDWPLLIAEAKKNILKKLSVTLGADICQYIACEQVLDPEKIESCTSSYQGSLYGNSSNSRFAAFLRHANKSSRISNLYFCGGSVHPGGGIPLALLSAEIAADWIK